MTSPDAPATRRISLDLGPSTVERLEQLRVLLEARSYAEVVRIALRKLECEYRANLAQIPVK